MKIKGHGLRRKVAIFRFTMLRGYMWCQMPALAIIGAGVIKPYFPNWSIYWLAIIAFGIFLGAGFLDRYFGILQEESNYSTQSNPLLMKGLFEENERRENGRK